MTEETSNLPALPTWEEREAEEKEQDFAELEEYWLDPEKDYPEPHFMFEYNGVGFSPLGGIQAISGQKKNGKTFVLSLLMAAAIDNGSQRLKQYLPGLNVREDTKAFLGHDPIILYCDTEMEQLYTAKVLRRVHWLCDLDMRSKFDRFHVLWLREVPKAEEQSTNKERWRLIKLAMEKVKPDIVFIDGLRDIVNNFNDLEESSEIINEMMAIASNNKRCIWNVLHFNPKPSNDDESKMRGHLGTELGNKVSDTFVSVKKKDAVTGQVTFTVKQQDARGKDVNDWTFEIVDDAGNLGIPKILSNPVSLTEAQKEQEELKKIDDIFKKFNWHRNGDTYTDLVKYITKLGYTSTRQIKNLRDAAVNAGIIYKDAGNLGKYHYNGLNKDLPDDGINNLPFERQDDNAEDVF